MGDEMLALVCWNLMCFLCYSRKIAGEYTTFKENAVKAFMESCNNPDQSWKTLNKSQSLNLESKIPLQEKSNCREEAKKFLGFAKHFSKFAKGI